MNNKKQTNKNYNDIDYKNDSLDVITAKRKKLQELEQEKNQETKET